MKFYLTFAIEMENGSKVPPLERIAIISETMARAARGNPWVDRVEVDPNIAGLIERLQVADLDHVIDVLQVLRKAR